MSRRSSALSSLRNDDGQVRRPDPGYPARRGAPQPLAFRLPPLDLFHPIESIKQRRLVKQHQTDLLLKELDQDSETTDDRMTQDEKSQSHLYRLDRFRDRISAEDDLAEALAEGQTRLLAVSQHYQRLTAIHTDNQLTLMDELIQDKEVKEAVKTSLRRQAKNLFVELESLAMNDTLTPENYGVTG